MTAEIYYYSITRFVYIWYLKLSSLFQHKLTVMNTLSVSIAHYIGPSIMYSVYHDMCDTHTHTHTRTHTHAHTHTHTRTHTHTHTHTRMHAHTHTQDTHQGLCEKVHSMIGGKRHRVCLLPLLHGNDELIIGLTARSYPCKLIVRPLQIQR